MDRLRSLQYFIAAAEEGSFSAASRRLDVSIPAVATLVAALERRLGVSLFERSSRGLSLTASGESYLEACRPAVAALEELDDQVRTSATRARGTVVVGIQHFVASKVLGPALPEFSARHPQIQVDFRESTQLVDPDTPGIDVYISFAWPQAPDMIHRVLGVSKFVVCAAPSYWQAHGKPQHPRDLAAHECILVRTQTGMLMDAWKFTRGDETHEVVLKSRLAFSNVHRDVAVSLAVAGHGVVRTLDWVDNDKLRSGVLVPVLTDWIPEEAPPLSLSYRPSERRLARVNHFIQFVQEVCRGWNAPGSGKKAVVGPVPRWAGSKATRVTNLRAPRAGLKSRRAKPTRP